MSQEKSNRDNGSNRGNRRGAITTAVILGLIALGLYLGFILVQLL